MKTIRQTIFTLIAVIATQYACVASEGKLATLWGRVKRVR